MSPCLATAPTHALSLIRSRLSRLPFIFPPTERRSPTSAALKKSSLFRRRRLSLSLSLALPPPPFSSFCSPFSNAHHCPSLPFPSLPTTTQPPHLLSLIPPRTLFSLPFPSPIPALPIPRPPPPFSPFEPSTPLSLSLFSLLGQDRCLSQFLSRPLFPAPPSPYCIQSACHSPSVYGEAFPEPTVVNRPSHPLPPLFPPSHSFGLRRSRTTNKKMRRTFLLLFGPAFGFFPFFY